MIKQLIKKIFKKTYQEIYQDGLNKGIFKGKEEKDIEKNKQLEISFDFSHKIGSFIVASPNEYDDIIVGKIIRHDLIGKSLIAIVYDYVRKEEILLLQKPFKYSLDVLKCFSDLTPDQRHIMIYGNRKNFTDINKNTIIGWDKMKKRLENNGFFDDLNK